MASSTAYRCPGVSRSPAGTGATRLRLLVVRTGQLGGALAGAAQPLAAPGPAAPVPAPGPAAGEPLALDEARQRREHGDHQGEGDRQAEDEDEQVTPAH